MHTQGPWAAKTRKVGSHVTGPDGFAVAQVGTEANARLIASAPDMYAALEDLLAHLWDGRKRDVKKDYSLMVAEVAARKAMERAG